MSETKQLKDEGISTEPSPANTPKPKKGEKQKIKQQGKKKVFVTSESMLSILDQVTEKQTQKINEKLERRSDKEAFFENKRKLQEEKKKKKGSRLEEIKLKLKSRKKPKVSKDKVQSDKPKKSVRFA